MRLDNTGTPRPGYYQIHASQGVTWRSTPPVRAYAESILAPKVSHFTATLSTEPTTPESYAAPYKRVYKLASSWLEITQQPWESIPTLHIIEERTTT